MVKEGLFVASPSKCHRSFPWMLLEWQQYEVRENV